MPPDSPIIITMTTIMRTGMSMAIATRMMTTTIMTTATIITMITAMITGAALPGFRCRG